jgi:hypothetical protein
MPSLILHTEGRPAGSDTGRMGFLTSGMFADIGNPKPLQPILEYQTGTMMPTTTKEKEGDESLSTAIRGRVLQGLGAPSEFCKVDVRPLWQDHYRVNVFVGRDITSARVAHSYFLIVDGKGGILSSTPTITRHYEMLPVE